MMAQALLYIAALMALWPPWPFGRHHGDDTQGTIGSLESVEVDIDTSAPIPGSEYLAMDSYRLFLDLVSDDPLLEAEAMRRLADLQLDTAEAEQLQRNLRELGGADDTIALYQKLLESYPDYEKNDLVLYQLSRAYEAVGRQDEALATLDRLVAQYPDTEHADEAQFRRGEMLFVNGRYAEAEDAYAHVVDHGPDSTFYEQALYKLGWAEFKQARHEESFGPFFRLLDLEFGDGEQFAAGQSTFDPAAIYDSMGRPEQELIDDTLRVISISMSYLDGPQSITATMKALGPRPYAYIVYSSLGDLYLDKERWQDAADTYRAFVDLDPYHEIAPFMQTQVIEAYKKGGFADLVLDGKREFVERYGPDSPYWQKFTYEDEPEVVAYLKSNVTDLAAYHHAQAQESGDVAEYEQAAHWYRVYLQSFPDDAKAPETNFLLAEVLFESRDFEAAAAEYERTAYDYAPHARSAEAGYAALLAYRERESTIDDPEAQEAWHRRGIGSALRFGMTFPDDERTASVETDAADQLFKLSEPNAASIVARRVVDRDPPPEPALLRTAWTVLAHSQFDLEHYEAAEAAYVALEDYVPADDPEQQDIVERIASSVYEQGAAARDAGDLAAAVDDFLRVGVAAPGSSIVATAQYDAAAALINLEQWQRAAQVLEDFRAAYPENELAGDVTEKLAVAYVESGDNAKAATEFERIADGDADAGVRQEALWRAAELYAETSQNGPASDAYARYVELYPDPVDDAIEARQRLVDLAAESDDYDARMKWLAEIVTADAGAGEARTDRTRYLAAHAALELAEPTRRAFETLKLVVPLEQSLATKRERMEDALAAYGKAADYGVADVTTAATFEIAELYHTLAKDLYDSERPAELSELELSQYDVLLEEQAYPFEEKAIELHEVNAARAANGIYDEWVVKSFSELAELLPARYAKQETREYVVEAVY